MTVQVVYPDEERLQELIKRLDKYDTELTKALRVTMNSVVKEGKKDVKKYMRSWAGPAHKPAPSYLKSKVKVDGPGKIFGQVKAQFYAMLEIGGREPGRFVEAGRGKKRSATIKRVERTALAMKSLEFWVQDKLGVPEQDAKRVAFAVAVSVGRHGTKGSNAMEKAQPEMKARADWMFNQTMDMIMAYLKGELG